MTTQFGVGSMHLPYGRCLSKSFMQRMDYGSLLPLETRIIHDKASTRRERCKFQPLQADM